MARSNDQSMAAAAWRLRLASIGRSRVGSLVGDTDGLVYHRTPAQQALDRKRDQALTAAGFIPLRFTNAQVRLEPTLVIATLRATTARLGTIPRR
jgi:very-short-patch-repair endonuclease